MKIMISQPMQGLTDQEIQNVRKNAIEKIERMGHKFVNSYFPNDITSAKYLKNPAIYALSYALDAMSNCDGVYFCDGWANARGCITEHDIAERYGLEIIDETEEIAKDYEKTQAFFEYEEEGESITDVEEIDEDNEN